MNTPISASRRHQQGAAALVTVVVLLAVIMLTTLSLSTTSTFEIRESADSIRQKEALAAAQAGLDLGAMKYLDNPSAYSSVSSASGNVVASASAPSTFTFTVSLASDSIDVSAVGISADTTGKAFVSESYGMANGLGFGNIVPFMAATTIPTGGSFTIVTNPNGAGNGVPMSAWVEDGGINGKASWQTCNHDEYTYQGGGACNLADDKICDSSSPESDCPDFAVDECVPDPFEIILGVSMPSRLSKSPSSGATCGSGVPYATARDEWQNTWEKDHSISCSDLNSGNYDIRDSPLQAPFVWIPEDCEITNQVGSAGSPIVMVINGDVDIKDDVYGVVIQFSPTVYPDYDGGYDGGNTSAPDHVFKITGNQKVYGAVMIMGDISHTAGTADVIYDADILDKLSGNGEGFSGLARIKGTWHDFE